MIEPHAAATVMVARDTPAGIEVFMLRRSSRSVFMPDVFVFPGGRVDPADSDPAVHRRLVGAPPHVDPAHIVAATRETFEECGLLFTTTAIGAADLAAARAALHAGTQTFSETLGVLQTSIDANSFRYFSRWITPPLEVRRFDTHFFVARAPAGQVAQADAFETHDGIWIAPAEALERAAAGTFALIFPTIKHLERLTDFRTVDALLAYAQDKPITAVMPLIDSERGLTIPPPLEGVW